MGNLVHTDDGVGVHAIRQLQLDPRVPPGVVLLDGGTQGLSLLPHISGLHRLLVIDAVDAGEAPGTVMKFEGTSLHGLPGKSSVHQLGFSDMMIAMQLMGETPPEVVVLGVQPLSTEWDNQLTPPVQDALPFVLDQAIRQLNDWAAPA
jgi:hydrogenase maturation protease